MSTEKAGAELLAALRHHFPDALQVDAATCIGAVKLIRDGSTTVTLPLNGELPPDHLRQIVPKGFDVGVGTTRHGDALQMQWTIWPRKRWCSSNGGLLRKTLAVASALVFLFAATYLLNFWGETLKNLSAEVVKRFGANHAMVTYGCLAVVVIVPLLWLYASLSTTKPRSKAD